MLCCRTILVENWRYWSANCTAKGEMWCTELLALRKWSILVRIRWTNAYSVPCSHHGRRVGHLKAGHSCKSQVLMIYSNPDCVEDYVQSIYLPTLKKNLCPIFGTSYVYCLAEGGREGGSGTGDTLHRAWTAQHWITVTEIIVVTVARNTIHYRVESGDRMHCACTLATWHRLAEQQTLIRESKFEDSSWLF